mgnify:CR=1 FL=1
MTKEDKVTNSNMPYRNLTSKGDAWVDATGATV